MPQQRSTRRTVHPHLARTVAARPQTRSVSRLPVHLVAQRRPPQEIGRSPRSSLRARTVSRSHPRHARADHVGILSNPRQAPRARRQRHRGPPPTPGRTRARRSSGVIEQAATGRVDDDGFPLHGGEFGRPEHMAIGRGEPCVHEMTSASARMGSERDRLDAESFQVIRISDGS